MLFVLESRHRLLHLRASLEREWSQSRRHSKYIRPSKFKIVSLRRNDLVAIDLGKLQNKKDHIAHNFRRDATLGTFKGFMIVSWKIPSFVHLNSNMIELKKYWSRWTNSRRKISDIIWRKQNTFDTERIGGSLSIIPENQDHWGIFLTSMMRWTH